MKTLRVAFVTEIMKLRRSKILWITIVFFAFIPIMMGLLMLVSQNPEIAEKLGIVGTKAMLFSENNWKGYLEMINQLIAVIGIIGFGFVTSWVFGREYVEKTVIDFITLPTSRATIISAKFLVVFAWSLLLTIVLFGTSIIIGKIINIPEWSAEIFNAFVHEFTIVSLLTIILSTPTAFVASYGRGIIAPLGFVILLVIMAQFVAVVGWGAYFPWAIPGYSTIPDVILKPVSYIIVLTMSLICYLGTIAWWRKADQQ
ncbi:MAG: ABC transporter permease [Bacteroidales bacterium]|nr:ABC transporter permease [Bacteroidales bacterium]